MKTIIAGLIGSLLTAGAFFVHMRCCKKSCATSCKGVCSKVCTKPGTINPTKFNLLGLKYPFTLDPLPYDYKALEPHIDEATMRVHHTKHHQAYIDNANKALDEAPELKQYSMEELLTNLDALPQNVRDRITNHVGGHFNHTLFWLMMSPQGGKPTELVATAIDRAFGSFDACKELFNKAAQSRFGSGWAWLCVDSKGALVVTSTGNQDTPLAQGLYPILGLDVWEHAYYLKYQNKRMDYISAFWEVVNWDYVAKLYSDGLEHQGK